jgi:uncharacterized protein YbjT (DUF2867 family)
VHGNLDSGEGLDDATANVDVIAHLASGSGDGGFPTYKTAKRTDVEGTQRLIDAAKRTGTPHLVHISIVGVDKVPMGYYRGKREAEGVVEASGLPFTILRTTQWHTLALEFCKRFERLPVVVLPKGLRMQLLDTGEVADRMSSLIDRPPPGRVADMGGPDVLAMTDVIRSYLRAKGKRRPVVALPLPGKVVRGFTEGHNLTPEHADGRITWNEFLARTT